MNEEELKAKAEELERREGELAKKEEELNAREEAIAKREDDAAKIAQTIKEEYEKKLSAIKADAAERLRQRDEVIRQLANGEAAQEETGPIAELNKRRLAQRRN